MKGDEKFKIGVVWGLGVTQGYQQHNQSIECIWFLFDSNRNYACILYHFWVIASDSLKVAKVVKPPPPVFGTLVQGDPIWIWPWSLAAEN